MGKKPGNSPLDLSDPLNRSHDAPQLDLGNADELISQLAGEEIDRLIHSDDDLTPVTDRELELMPTTREAALAARPPVEELAAQLDQVFDDIRRRAPEPPPVRIDMTTPEPITLPEPVLAMRRMDEVEARELEHRRSLLDPIEETPSRIVRWLSWLNAPVQQLSRGPRMAVSVVSLLSFAGSLAALFYVLMLRRGI